MIYLLATALPALVIGCAIYCMFFCQGCARRRAEQRQIDMQLQAGREVNEILRAERARTAKTAQLLYYFKDIVRR